MKQMNQAAAWLTCSIAANGARSQACGGRLAIRKLIALLVAFHAAILASPAEPLFSREGLPTPQAVQAILLLQGADAKGLDPAEYDAPLWAGRVAALAAPDRAAAAARFDAELAGTLARYAAALHHGRVDPRSIGIDLEFAKERVDVDALVREAAVAPDVADLLARVEPRHRGYARLLAALERYRALALAGPLPYLPEVRKLEPGGTYPALDALADALIRLGDLAEADRPPPGATRYAGAVVEGVRRTQSRHGLAQDGILGPKTIGALSLPLAARVRQIELTLERWRWTPSRADQPRIVVNIPEFRLRAYDEEGRVALSSEVVVGRAYRHQTPVFAGLMRTVVFHPFWNVPVGITRRELLPGLAKSPRTLAAGDYEIVTPRGALSADGPLAATTLRALRSGAFTLRQRPGAKNALGRVKFLFPNDYDVYLHDTPARVLFSRSRRDFSHGCIRVNAADELAVWVLREHPELGPEAVRAALDAPETREVTLPRPIPVLIVYGTVVVLDDGAVRFFDDLYGHDAELDRALRERH